MVCLSVVHTGENPDFINNEFLAAKSLWQSKLFDVQVSCSQ